MTGSANIAPRSPRWQVYLLLGRVSNLPTIWTNCLAGVLLAGAVPDALTMLPLLAALSLFYTGGMLLNDAFDECYDTQHRPERPIPRRKITPREVFVVGFGMLALGEALLALPALLREESISSAVLLAGLVLALLIVYYNYRHKTDPLAPLVMALCRGMVYIIAAVVAGTVTAPPVMGGVVVIVGYLIGLTYVARQENLKAVGNLWPLLFLAAPFVYAAAQFTPRFWPALMFVVFLAWVLYALSFLVRTAGRDISRSVVGLIAGISLLDGLLIAVLPGGVAWAWLAVAGFVLTLAFQRFVPGT